jgi:hypothetical protein
MMARAHTIPRDNAGHAGKPSRSIGYQVTQRGQTAKGHNVVVVQAVNVSRYPKAHQGKQEAARRAAR